MHPELFSFRIFGNGITVYSYGFMIFTGMVAAFLYAWYRRKEFGLNFEGLADIFLWCFAGIFIGGKLFYYFEDPKKYLSDPSLMFKNIGSGFVFYGSFLVTIPLMIWQFRKKKLNVRAMFDVIAISGGLVHGLGKVGCLLAGCCHGKVCSKDVGIRFTDPHSVARPLNEYLYPVQVWDAAIILCTVLFMMWWYRRKNFDGQLMLIYSVVYGVGRAITEVYRGDEERGFLFGGLLSHSQFLAIVIIIGATVLWWKWSRRGRSGLQG